MKYLYQQLFAFLAVILTVLLIVGISFTQFTHRTIETNTFKQLEGYANSIMENGLGNIEYYEHVLKEQQVHFLYITADETVRYPSTQGDTEPAKLLTKHDWENLRKGKSINKILKIKLLNQDVAITAVPCFVWSSDQQEKLVSFDGSIVAYQPISSIKNSMTDLTENLLKGFLISTVVAIIVSYFFAKFQVKRINRMRTATNQIATGNFNVHLDSHGKDEFDDLAEDFNQMAVSLKQSNVEIERQEERRRQFMADAAHEMRTPLTTINGLLEGLAYNAIPENQKEKCIELMQNETKRLIRLVNENLDYEKIRSNQISIVVQKFNATHVLETLQQQLNGKAEDAGNALVLATKEPIDVYADYDRFVQIMVNIIQNAIQFTSNGTITLSVEKGYLETRVKIADTGIGMTEDEVQNIWERYYKADPSRKNTKYGESGLGLAIVHQLVKLHKGKITVESQKNVGTTFTITFPDIELVEKQQQL